MYGYMSSAATAAVNTTISTAAGGLGCLLLNVLIGAPGDVGPLANGIVAGAVAITASCALVESYAPLIIGLVAAAVYQGTSELLVLLGIDDPLNASPVHLFCGAWGLLASGFFATESKVTAAYGYAGGWGVFYGGGGTQFGIQILGIVSIWAWSTAWATAIFIGLNKAGWLRVDREVELHGLDLSQSIGFGQLFGGFGFAKFRKGKQSNSISTSNTHGTV
jgi:Amt family ammonium transporter